MVSAFTLFNFSYDYRIRFQLKLLRQPSQTNTLLFNLTDPDNGYALPSVSLKTQTVFGFFHSNWVRVSLRYQRFEYDLYSRIWPQNDYTIRITLKDRRLSASIGLGSTELAFYTGLNFEEGHPFVNVSDVYTDARQLQLHVQNDTSRVSVTDVLYTALSPPVPIRKGLDSSYTDEVVAESGETGSGERGSPFFPPLSLPSPPPSPPSPPSLPPPSPPCQASVDATSLSCASYKPGTTCADDFDTNKDASFDFVDAIALFKSRKSNVGTSIFEILTGEKTIDCK